MEPFGFTLTQEEKQALKDLVYQSIQKEITGKDEPLPEPPTERLLEHFGAFVTLKVQGRLRGCIGHVLGDKPLWDTVREMAVCAAMQDPRFPPMHLEELEQAQVEISVLSPMRQVEDPEAVEPGRHGLMIQRGFHSGLLLPQVATEWGWDRETFLDQTCLKAGLPRGCWRSKKVQLLVFEAEVF